MSDPADRRRVDERETMFARNARRPGTPPYQDFYARHPQLKFVDDRMRAALGLCGKDARYYDERIAAATPEWFGKIGSIPPWTHRPALWFDDVIYGRSWNSTD